MRIYPTGENRYSTKWSSFVRNFSGNFENYILKFHGHIFQMLRYQKIQKAVDLFNSVYQ